MVAFMGVEHGFRVVSIVALSMGEGQWGRVQLKAFKEMQLLYRCHHLLCSEKHCMCLKFNGPVKTTVKFINHIIWYRDQCRQILGKLVRCYNKHCLNV